MDTLIESAQNAFDVLQPHPYLQALLIIVLFLILAKITDLIISGMLARLVRRTQNVFDDQFLGAIHRPIFSTVGLIGLILASHRLGLDEKLQHATVAVVETVLLLIWLTFLLRFLRLVIGVMRHQERRFDFVQQTTEPLLANALAVFVFIAGAYLIMLVWNINVTGLVASAGIVGLALSFAAQDTLANLFAGVAILTDQPYKIGDYIILDSSERGQVTHIGLRSTRLLTRDDVEVSIPNGVMGSAKIVNEAGGPPDRFRIGASVGVAYGSDVDQVIEVLSGVGIEHADVLQHPEPRVRFRTFGDSSLNFELLCWIAHPADRGRVVHELNCQIYREFAVTGIIIPFPQRDVHIRQVTSESES